MPHAITEAFSADDTLSEAAHGTAAAVASSRAAARQHEQETPNERAMRAATAARKSKEVKRQQG